MRKKDRVNKKIRDSARGEDCALRTPLCNEDPETTVYCHAPSVDKGMGIKSPDWWGSYGCYNCHLYQDGMPPDAADYWLPAIYETQKKLREKGLL